MREPRKPVVVMVETMSERDELLARCERIKADRDQFVKDSGPWKARARHLDVVLGKIWALGPVEA